MDKRSENFIKLLGDLEKEGGLNREESVDLLKRLRDGTKTEEDEKILEKISNQ